MNRIEIERAIVNIFNEEGYEVLNITENTIKAKKYIEAIYSYEVDNDKDIIVIRNRQNRIVFEKYISSYQDLNVTVTID